MRINYFAHARVEHAQNWAKWLTGRGHDVLLYSPDPSKTAGVLPKSQLKRFTYKPRPADINHVWYIYRQYLAAWLKSNRPNLASGIGSDLLKQARGGIDRIIDRHALKHAYVLVEDAKTRTIARSLVQDPSRVRLTRMGIDTETYRPPAQRPDPGAILYMRGFNKVYDPCTLIRAAQRLDPAQDWRVTMVGGGSELGKLEVMVADGGLADRVDIVADRLPQPAIPRLLQGFTIAVNTSTSDSGISVANLQAMSTGLALASTDNAENPRWIDRSTMFRPGDDAGLADILGSLLGRPARTRKIGAKNRATILKNFSEERAMRRVEAVYEEAA